MLPFDSPRYRWSASDYPLANDLGLDGDLLARRIVRVTGFPNEISDRCDWSDVTRFTADLTAGAQRTLTRLLSVWARENVEDRATRASRNRSKHTITGAIRPSTHRCARWHERACPQSIVFFQLFRTP